MRVFKNQITLLTAAVCALFALCASANVHPPTEQVQVVHVVEQDVAATPDEVVKAEQVAQDFSVVEQFAVAETSVPATEVVQPVAGLNGVAYIDEFDIWARWRQ